MTVSLQYDLDEPTNSTRMSEIRSLADYRLRRPAQQSTFSLEQHVKDDYHALVARSSIPMQVDNPDAVQAFIAADRVALSVVQDLMHEIVKKIPDVESFRLWADIHDATDEGIELPDRLWLFAGVSEFTPAMRAAMRDLERSVIFGKYRPVGITNIDFDLFEV